MQVAPSRKKCRGLDQAGLAKCRARLGVAAEVNPGLLIRRVRALVGEAKFNIGFSHESCARDELPLPNVQP